MEQLLTWGGAGKEREGFLEGVSLSWTLKAVKALPGEKKVMEQAF